MAVPGGSSPLNPLFQIIAFGAGTAMAPVLRPVIQDLEYEAWRLAPVRVPAATLLASGVAQGQVDPAKAREWARDTGFADDRWDALVSIANVGPGVAAAFEMWRRRQIGEPGFRRAVKRLGLEAEWIDDLVALKEIRLSPAEIANAVQQGHVPNPGVLPNISAAVAPGFQTFPAIAPDAEPPSSVPLTQIDINPLIEAEAHGVDADRLKVIANLAGLPPGPEALLTMWNRALIDEDSVDAGIREGHMKTKWTGPFKRMRWAVLSGQDYAELHLRDWISEDEMYHGGALTGHTPEQMRRLFQNRGRTATPRQVWLAAARKKIGPRGVVTTQLDHEQAIRRSNIRPEYSDMLWEIRFNYPPLFQLNRLVQQGAINPDTAAEWATWNLYGPEVITALTKYWRQIYPGDAAAALPPADPHVTKAQVQLWGTTHRTFVAAESNEGDARARFDLLGIPGDAQGAILELWASERELIRKQLTPAQIKKAWSKMSKNYATGAPWTRDDAIAALVSQGYSTVDANDFLDIPSGP